MHKICITNLNDNEQITHSFVLIKGTIAQKANCSQVCNFITLTTTGNKLDIQSPLKNDSFKFLVKLSHGLNEFIITFCCVNQKFALQLIEKATDFVVTPLYLICEGHDGKFQAPITENNSIESACRRIMTGAKLLQCVIAEKLFEQNLGRKTFKLDQTCHVFYSKLQYQTARRMKQKELWDYFARELIQSNLNSGKRKFLGLLSCTRFQRNEKFLIEDVVEQTQAHVALGAGGLALFGSGCLYTWPENINDVIPRFLNENSVDINYFMDDSCHRGTLGYCFSTTLGSVLHELCHTFDLGHTKTGVMGRGFDDIYKVFTEQNGDGIYFTKNCAALLRYHKWINGITEPKKMILKYDLRTNIVKSTAGIKVVEIRRESDEMVLESWIFASKVLKFSFRIPEETFKEFHDQKLIVVVGDAIGNIVKENLDGVMSCDN